MPLGFTQYLLPDSDTGGAALLFLLCFVPPWWYIRDPLYPAPSNSEFTAVPHAVRMSDHHILPPVPHATRRFSSPYAAIATTAFDDFNPARSPASPALHQPIIYTGRNRRFCPDTYSRYAPTPRDFRILLRRVFLRSLFTLPRCWKSAYYQTFNIYPSAH